MASVDPPLPRSGDPGTRLTYVKAEKTLSVRRHKSECPTVVRPRRIRTGLCHVGFDSAIGPPRIEEQVSHCCL